jgi:hypothetical protein
MVLIVRTDRFDRCQEQLRKGDARAVAAARNAEEIIAALVEDGGGMTTISNKLTCHGEARLDKALKFDLGGGYRLISARQGKVLLFLFSGTHDECDRWLENNRGKRFSAELDGVPVHKVAGVKAPVSGEEPGSCDDYEQLIWGKITQKDLREIFSGFYGNR